MLNPRSPEPGESLLCIECHDCLPYEEHDMCAACLADAYCGEPCPVALRDCKKCQQDAIDAGIPRSVVLGKTTLREHFSQTYIDAQCGVARDDDGKRVAQ